MVFGHEEILQGMTRRKTRVKSKSNSVIFYMGSDEFKEYYPEVEINKLKDSMRILDIN